MNAAVSNAYPQNDSGKSVRDIIDRTIYNKVRLRRSDTPCVAVCQAASVVKRFHTSLGVCQTRDSNILLHDQIVETLFSCYDDFPLHSEIA